MADEKAIGKHFKHIIWWFNWENKFTAKKPLKLRRYYGLIFAINNKKLTVKKYDIINLIITLIVSV